MNRITILADIAGRLSRDTRGSSHVTAASVVVGSGSTAELSSLLRTDFPKWQSCRREDAIAIVQLLANNKTAAAAINMDKNTAAWGRFWQDVRPLQEAIVKQSRSAAGFIKPANIMAFHLIGWSAAICTAEAIRLYPPKNVLDRNGRRIVERTVVYDTDISYDEIFGDLMTFARSAGNQGA